ncbi:chitin binding Peritrophin-A domain protein, partial [Cooperia oncophora]
GHRSIVSIQTDGYYEKERCQPYFYSCVAGRTEVLECTTGLVYDARISACDYPEACSYAVTASAATAMATSLCFAENEPYTGIDWKTVKGCEEKREENFYVLGCNQVFYRCYVHVSLGSLFRYFDPKRNRCNHKEKTSTCLNEARITSGTPAPSEQVSRSIRDVRADIAGHTIDMMSHESSAILSNKCGSSEFARFSSGPIAPAPNYAPVNAFAPPVISAPAPPPPPAALPKSDDDELCLNRPDGEYSAGDCSNIFYKCANGKLFKYRCPMCRPVYNHSAKQCQMKENVPACKVFDREAARQNFDCSGKTDGYYEKERCQPYFYSCVAGRTEVLECTTGLVFDARISAMMNYPVACSGQAHFKLKSSHQSLQRIMVRSTVEDLDHQFLLLARMGRMDSSPFKSVPMLSFSPPQPVLQSPSVVPQRGPVNYGKCLNGTSYTMNCPARLVFNDLNGYCDYPGNCPWMCADLANGAHAVGACTAEYASCWGGVKSDARCPGNLIFNPVNGQCDYEHNVAGCLMMRGNVAHQPPRQPVTIAQEPPRQLMSVAQQPARPDVNAGKFE